MTTDVNCGYGDGRAPEKPTTTGSFPGLSWYARDASTVTPIRTGSEVIISAMTSRNRMNPNAAQ